MNSVLDKCSGKDGCVNTRKECKIRNAKEQQGVDLKLSALNMANLPMF